VVITVGGVQTITLLSVHHVRDLHAYDFTFA
jgi:hypothetical protein